jgi:hypothetical protein
LIADLEKGPRVRRLFIVQSGFVNTQQTLLPNTAFVDLDDGELGVLGEFGLMKLFETKQNSA